MEYLIPVYSEQDLTPRASEVIRAIVDDAFPEHTIKFLPYDRYRHDKVLVFGRAPEAVGRVLLVYTYSVAQIMSKANAASVLTAGIRNFISEPDPVPFEGPEGSWTASVLCDLDYNQPVCIDIETDGNLGETHTPEEVSVISVAVYQPGHPPIVVHGEWRGDLNRTMPLKAETLNVLAELLPRFKYGIYHNGKFDVRVLNRVLGVKLVVWFDTMLAHHTLNHAAGDHKLKTLARRYLGAPEWEADLKKYTRGGGHYELIPVHLLVEYNGWDVYWAYKLFEFLAPQIYADENNVKAYSLEMAAADFLLDVENYGIPFDSGYARAEGEKLRQHAAMVKENLTSFAWPGFNPGSWQQVKRWFSEHQVNLPDTSEESIQGVIDIYPPHATQHHFGKSLLEYRKATKTDGTYYTGWMKKARHGRVHPTYLVHGTSTGRLSSTSPNAQNVPRDKTIRKMVKTHG